MLSNAIDLFGKDILFWLILIGLIAVALVAGEYWAKRKGGCL